MTDAADAAASVVTRARSKPVFARSRIRTTVTARVPKTECHRQVSAAAWMAVVLPYRVTVTGVNAAAPASLAREGSLAPFSGGRPRLPVRAGGGSYSAASLRSRVVHVTRPGSFFS